MTIPANTAPVSTYIGNNTTFQFPFYFRMIIPADLIVSAVVGTAAPVILVQGVDYSYTFNSFPQLGGQVSLIGLGQTWMTGANLKTGATLVIQFMVSPSQLFKFRDWGPLAPLQVEQAFDGQAMQMLGMQQEISTAITIPIGGSGSLFPPLTGQAGLIVEVNGTETGFAYGVSSAAIFAASAAAIAAEAAALAAQTAAAVSAATASAAVVLTNADLAAITVIEGNVLYSEAQAAGKAVDADISASQALASMNTAIAQVPLATAQADIATARATEATIEVELLYYTSVVDLTFADSPFTVATPADKGKLFRVDTSGGNVIINLPARPSISPDFRVSITKVDNSANFIQVFPNGADTIAGQPFTIMSLQDYGFTFQPGIFSDWLQKTFSIGGSGSGLPTLVTETPAGVIDGVNTIFTISQQSLTQSLNVFLDGVRLETVEYALVGTTISLVSAPAIGQTLSAWYFATTTIAQGIKGAEEVPVGVIDGVNGTFTLTTMPFNKPSMMVFKNGLYVNADTWTLTQTVTGSTINFTAGNEPGVGSTLAVFYLVNQLQVVSIVPPAPVGGSGAFVVHGNRLAPIVIDNLGITVADERRALWYIKSNGGQVTIPGVQISAGYQIGDELVVVGVDPVDYITMVDGQGIESNGNIDFIAGVPGPGVFTTKRYFIYDGVVWSETPMS